MAISFALTCQWELQLGLNSPMGVATSFSLKKQQNTTTVYKQSTNTNITKIQEQSKQYKQHTNTNIHNKAIQVKLSFQK